MTENNDLDILANSDSIKAALFFMDSGDYYFKWKEIGRISHKCLTATDVAAAFTKTEVDSGWITPGILRHGYGAKGPWAVLEIKAERHEINLIKPGGEEEKLSFVFPNLMMIGVDRTYYLVAIGEDTNPKTAKVFNAPFTNVHTDHKICWGSNNPLVAGVDTMLRAWRMFVELPFNSDLASGKSNKYSTDIRKAWRKFGNEAEWPVTDLVSCRQTLDQAIRNVTGGSNGIY